MGAEVDRLEVQVEAQASKANKQLDSLINKLERVSTALTGVNASGLTGFANGISKIAGASAQLGNVKTADFTRLAKNLEKMAGVDQSSLNRTSASLNAMSQSLGKIRGASQSALQISELAKNISKLGNKSVQSAMENMPKLASGLSEMMATLSKAPAVSNNLIQMTNALASLASQGSKVGSVINSMGATGSKGTSLLSGWLGKLTTSTGRATKATKSFSQIAGSFYANFYVAMRGLRSAWSATGSSMDFLETVNYFEVAMRKLGDDAAANWEQAGYDSAEAYAKSFSERAKQLTQKMTGYNVDEDGNTTYAGVKNLGMNPESVMNYQAMFAQVSESIGVAEESALNFSTALTMLGADWASLRNTTFEQAWEKFASALAGQSRAVRAFGIDITNATLQEYAYKYGLTTAIAEMNQATKAQLRLLAILDQSKVAFGDLANTMQSPSNQLRMLRQNFSNLARTIGNLFLPIVEKVLPYINGLVMALQRLFTWIGSLLGIKFNSINSSIGGMDNGFEDLVGGADDAEDSLNGANDAAKKLKNTILGFDEINQLNDNTDSSGGSGSGGGIGGGSPLLDEEIANALVKYQEEWDKAFDRMENKAQDIADRICNAFKRGDYEGIGRYISTGITKGLESINWDSVYSVAKKFGTGFAEFLNGLISPSLFGAVGKTIAGALNTAIYAELSFGETFDFKNLGNSIASGINNFFRTFDFGALAQTFNVWAKGILDAIITALDNTDWEMIGRQIGTFFAELDFMEVGAKVGKAIWKAINAGLEVFARVFDAAPIETTIVTMLGFNKAWKAIFGTNVISGLSKVSKGWKTFSEKIFLVTKSLKGNKAATNLLNACYPELGKKIKNVSSTFASFQKNMGGSFWSNLKGSIENIRNSMTGLQKGVTGAIAVFGEFTLVKSGFKDIASGADNLVASIGKIAAGAGLASAALYTAFGPAGLVVAGITGVVGAVKGINEAIDEIRLNSMFETLKTNGVTSLEDLSNVATKTFDEITSGVDETKEKLDSISQTKESIEGTTANIDKLRSAIDNGAYTASEKVPEIIQQFQSLLEESKSVFEEEYEVITGNMAGAWYDFLTAQGVAVPEAIAQLASYREQANTAYAEIEDTIESLTEEFNNGKISPEEYNSKLEPLLKQIAEANGNGAIDNATKAIQDFGGALDLSKYIDENNELSVDSLISDIDIVTQSAKDAQSDLDSVVGDNKETLDDYKQYLESMGVDMSGMDWSVFYGASDSQQKKGEQAIKDAYQSYADQLQYCLLEQLPSVVEDATAGYEDLAPWEKFFTSKEEYVQEAINEWKSNVFSPITKKIQGDFEQLGIDGSLYAEDAADKMITSIFDEIADSGAASMNGSNFIKMKEDWKTSLNTTFDEVTKNVNPEKYGEEMGTKYTDGLSKSSSKLDGVMGNFTNIIGVFTGKATSDFNSLRDNISNSTDSSANSISSFGQSSSYNLNSLGNPIMSTRESFVDLARNIANSSDSSKTAIGSFGDKISSVMSTAIDKVLGFSQSANTNFDSTKGKANDLSSTLDTTTESAKNLYNQSGKTFEIKTDTNSFSTLRGAISGVFDAVNNLFSFNGRTLAIGGGISVAGTGSIGIRGYATGGFPETGELFMARENGINEMVGRIGNHSAVATNDQIVEGIQSGVEAAMMNVMMAFAGQQGSGSGGGEPTLEFTWKTDNETIYKMAMKGKESYDRRYHITKEI